LNASEDFLEIERYKEGEFELAARRYAEAERSMKALPGVDIVLVRADSIDALRRAYPNYFSATFFFLDLLTDATS
jgi:hypothetical protein